VIGEPVAVTAEPITDVDRDRSRSLIILRLALLARPLAIRSTDRSAGRRIEEGHPDLDGGGRADGVSAHPPSPDSSG